MYRRILVPVDGSIPSRLAVQHALALVRRGDAELRLVHVVDWAGLFLDVGMAPELVYDLWTRTGQDILDRAAARARRSAVRASATLLERPGSGVSRAIVDEATRWPAELIVMGTHGRRGLSRLLFGSVAEGVIRAAPVPVLVIRAASRAEPVDVTSLGIGQRVLAGTGAVDGAPKQLRPLFCPW